MESGKVVETEFRPLVKTALERHEAIQINDDRGLRNVKEQNREQPEKEMRRSQLGRCADPARADDKDNLGQDEVEQAEWLF